MLHFYKKEGRKRERGKEGKRGGVNGKKKKRKNNCAYIWGETLILKLNIGNDHINTNDLMKMVKDWPGVNN